MKHADARTKIFLNSFSPPQPVGLLALEFHFATNSWSEMWREDLTCIIYEVLFRHAL